MNPLHWKDPVCGMSLSIQKSKDVSIDYQGKPYYFCSDFCRQKFLESPIDYLNPSFRSRSHASNEALYTCPMHPQVRQPSPGHCPICGMILEPPLGDRNDPIAQELKDMSLRFYFSLILTVPLFLIEMSAMSLPDQIQLWTVPWIQFLLATPVVYVGALPLFKRGFYPLPKGQTNMFTLISLGILTTYGYSTVATVWPQIFPASSRGPEGGIHLYFETCGTIIVFVLLGQMLELKARGKTTQALQGLFNLSPKTVRIVGPDGIESDLPLEQVQKGDHLRVRPGEKVPVDGSITEGNGNLDESMLTGESIPVEKTKGNQVTGGSLNGTGSFVMEAEKVGSDTFLARMIDLVSQAQKSRAPIQRMADNISSLFVPFVMALSALTFVLWLTLGPAPRFSHALISAVSVLMVACPCALGLATPLSMMVGIGRGARMGILIKNAEALETLEKINTLVSDKTGTLTVGKPRLVRVKPAPSFTETDLLSFAASLENSSEHPLAHSIVSGARERGISFIPAMGVQSYPGKGISGTVKGQSILLGNDRLIKEMKIDIGYASKESQYFRDRGETVTYVGVNGIFAGFLALTDPLKASATDAVQLLKKEKIRLIIATGDHPLTTQTIAHQLGIGEIESDILPEGKLALIRRLQSEQRRVAMVGDGVNDAPALAQADVGIGIGTGTDIAIESADVVLVKGDLNGVVRALHLSRATMRNARQNLFFAFLYNILSIPIAAGALYPAFGVLFNPALASLAMSLSSVCVIGNALRLQYVSLKV